MHSPSGSKGTKPERPESPAPDKPPIPPQDDAEGGLGAGRKHNVQLPPSDQRANPDPKEH